MKKVILLVAMLAFSTSIFAQIRVSGTVTDADTHDPLVGVNVYILGTTTGTLTDTNGNYSINVPNEDVVLVYSYIGYHTEDRVVGDRTTINVEMHEDIDESPQLNDKRAILQRE